MNSKIKQLRNKLEYLKGQRDQLQKTIDDLKEKIRDDKRTLIRYERALEIVKQVGLLTQKQFEYHLAEQVSLAMEAVFDNPDQLKVNFQEKRGRTEAEILFVKGNLEFPPLGNAGGGTIDVAIISFTDGLLVMRRDKKISLYCY